MKVAFAETAKAAEAFADYVALGPGRTLEALATEYQNATKSVPTKQLSRLKVWSTKYRWQDRIRGAATERSLKALEEAAELDAETFLESSRRLNGIVVGPGFIPPADLVRMRESVRKPEPKGSSVVDVTHSGTIKHDHVHRDMSAFTDDEMEQLAAIAERVKVGE